MLYYIFYRNIKRDEYGRALPESFLNITAGTIKESDYTFVCTLEADNLEHVFRLMNVVDNDPSEIPQKIHNRSLSVGDVVLDDNGVAKLCDCVGWTTFQDPAFLTTVQRAKPYTPKFLAGYQHK